ncbi:FACT complex subunit spt16-like [Planococcus citri]|uniref:FACT complex subunit spt16-like n=1 Tax=Planococcus citri TaxID=170843 RepID=UPI0031F8621A
MSTTPLDRDNFFKRMKILYSAWKEGKTECGEPFPKVDSICTSVGSDDHILYCKSLSLQIWLLGYEINDVIMIFSEKCIQFLASKKKIEFLRQVQQHKDKSIPPVKLLVRNKDGPDSEKDNFEKMIAALKASGKGKSLGVFVKDDFPGPLVESWKKALEEHNFENVDISNALASLLSVKEESELSVIKKACQITVNVYQKYLRDQIWVIVDSDRKVKHSKLADEVEDAMADKKYVGSNVDTTQLTTCYPPIIQSGGNYSLKFSAQSDENNLHFGVIICSLGARYKMYCSNMVRTVLVNPNDSVQENYNFLVDLQEHLISVLKSGTRLCDVYNSGIDFAREKKPSLVENLTSNFGFVTGIEFRENSLCITSKTTSCARNSQVYNLCVGLSNLINKDADSGENKNYSLFIGDTVVVNEDGPATVLTNSNKQIKNKNVGIFLKETESADEEEESEKETEIQQPRNLRRGKRSAGFESKLRKDTSGEEKRKQHQKELSIRLNEQARQRLLGQSSGTQTERVKKSNESYQNYDQMPADIEVKQLKLFVDKKYETVILPIFGLPVPFHISTIKNISQSVEGDYTYLRINFFHSGATVTGGEGSQFAKEVTYRSKNLRQPDETATPSANLNNAFSLIKEVQKKFKTREVEEKQKEDLIEQDTLIISSNQGNPKLKDLYIRPTIGKKGMKGTLEAHVNGFRYTSAQGDKVDILYNNIKHAFFQPGDREAIILLHFHLKNAIMFGKNKKKFSDVQFYTEVGEQVTDLGKNQHMRDRDDLSADQAERELRFKLKTAFKSFTEKVEAATKKKVDFDSPFRDLGFVGAANRSTGTVLLLPTTDCLVNLTEWPPFVITLGDVELVHFELSLKNFDMLFVLKDYRQKVVTVNAIPMNKLDHVKEWLNSRDVKYSERSDNLNWPEIMKKILKDPKGFFDEEGGWTFLDPVSDSEERGAVDESSDEDGDEAYEPSDLSEESAKDWSDSERDEAEEDDSEGGGTNSEDGSKSKSHRRSSPKKSSRDHDKRHRESSRSSHRSSSLRSSSSHSSKKQKLM